MHLFGSGFRRPHELVRLALPMGSSKPHGKPQETTGKHTSPRDRWLPRWRLQLLRNESLHVPSSFRPFRRIQAPCATVGTNRRTTVGALRHGRLAARHARSLSLDTCSIKRIGGWWVAWRGLLGCSL